MHPISLHGWQDKEDAVLFAPVEKLLQYEGRTKEDVRSIGSSERNNDTSNIVQTLMQAALY